MANARAITQLYFGAAKTKAAKSSKLPWRRHPILTAAEKQLREYFAGKRTQFELPLAPKGTDFQKQAWKLLQEIPYGHTITYGEQARRAGRPSAHRAIGAANGRNPICIIVPCHRVISSSGELTGYAFGIPTKKKLLELEAGSQKKRR